MPAGPAAATSESMTALELALTLLVAVVALSVATGSPMPSETMMAAVEVVLRVMMSSGVCQGATWYGAAAPKP